MSINFKFSANDFIATLNLISTVIDVLRDFKNVSLKYRELVYELYIFEQVFFRIKRIKLDES